VRVVRWAFGLLALAALGAFLLGLLAPRRKVPATPVPTYVAPPPAEDATVTVPEAVPLEAVPLEPAADEG